LTFARNAERVEARRVFTIDRSDRIQRAIGAAEHCTCGAAQSARAFTQRSVHEGYANVASLRQGHQRRPDLGPDECNGGGLRRVEHVLHHLAAIPRQVARPVGADTRGDSFSGWREEGEHELRVRLALAQRTQYGLRHE
jgi:hypothetical protein